MAFTDVGPLWIPTVPGGLGNETPSATGLITLDVANEAAGFVFRVPKTGTLDKVEFRVGTVTNNPDNGIRVSFQSLTANLPDNVQDQFRNIAGPISSDTWLIPGLITSDGTDGGVKRSVTVGDYMAVVIENASFVAGDSFQIVTLNPVAATSQLVSAQHYAASRNSASVWAGSAAQGFPSMILKYDDGTYAFLAPLWYPWIGLNTVTWNSTSTPDERGLRFINQVTMRLIGIWIRGLFNTAGTDVVLYDSSSSVLYTSTISTAKPGQSYLIPIPPTTITAGDIYRVIVKPGVSNVQLYDFTVQSNAHFAAVEGGIEWYYTQRTDAGAWTDTNTKRPWIGLCFDAIEVSSGGGTHASAF